MRWNWPIFASGKPWDRSCDAFLWLFIFQLFLWQRLNANLFQLCCVSLYAKSASTGRLVVVKRHFFTVSSVMIVQWRRKAFLNVWKKKKIWRSRGRLQVYLYFWLFSWTKVFVLKNYTQSNFTEIWRQGFDSHSAVGFQLKRQKIFVSKE